MEAWQWFGLIPTSLVVIMLASMVIITAVDFKISAPKRKANRQIKNNPELMKSDAFIQGFRDMANAFARASRSYIDTDISLDMFRNPSLPEYSVERIGEEAIKSKHEFDLEMGQTSERYLGGTDQEFQDYYLGGLHFISVMDDAKTKAVEKRDAKKRQKALIEARKKGIRDVNAKIARDMVELDTLRNKTFSTEEFEKNWDLQLKEISNGVL